MKVIIVSSMYVRPDKVSAVFVHRQVVELVRLGIDARVVCPIPRFSASGPIAAGVRKEPSRATIDGIEVTYLPYWNVSHRVSPHLDALSLRATLGHYLRKIRPIHDFELIHSFRLFPTGFAALSVGRAVGVPVVIGARGSDVHTHPWRNRAIARCTRTVIDTGDRILSVSEALARQIHELGQPRAPVEVVYNGVDTERFRPVPDRASLRRELGLPVDGVGLIFVGRLTAEKGLWELVHAFEMIARETPNTWLAIVGTGPIRRQLEEWHRVRGPAGRVIFPGAQPHERVPDWLNAADIFVLPSYNEGLPNGVLEAMACGLPVVSTHVGGIPEAISDRETGFLVPPRTVPPLAAALRSLILDSDLRERMGRSGLDRVHSRFLWSRSAEQLRRVYHDTIRSNARPA